MSQGDERSIHFIGATKQLGKQMTKITLKPTYNSDMRFSDG